MSTSRKSKIFPTWRGKCLGLDLLPSWTKWRVWYSRGGSLGKSNHLRIHPPYKVSLSRPTRILTTLQDRHQLFSPLLALFPASPSLVMSPRSDLTYPHDTLYPNSKATMNSWSAHWWSILGRRCHHRRWRPTPVQQPSILDTASTMERCGCVPLIPRRGGGTWTRPQILRQPRWGGRWVPRRWIMHRTAGDGSGEGALLLWYRGEPRHMYTCTGLANGSHWRHNYCIHVGYHCFY